MTKAQEVFERVEALVASGVRKADAFRQVAEEFGQPFNSMRGAYYAHTRTLTSGGQPGPARKREKAPADPVEAATLLLNKAIEAIESEITIAKNRADAAQAAYEQLLETAQERKDAILEKIAKLNS